MNIEVVSEKRLDKEEKSDRMEGMNEEIKTKRCSRCKIEKLGTCFGINKASRDGLNACCKECFRKDREAKALIRKPIVEQKRKEHFQRLRKEAREKTTKICSVCKIEKNKADFSPNGNTPRDGLRSSCKDCVNKRNAIRYGWEEKANRQKEKILAQKREIQNRISKICSICRLDKSLDQFYKNKSSPDGHQYTCIECYKEYSKNNKEKIAIESRNRRMRNKEHYDAKVSEWRSKNKDKTIIYARNWLIRNPERAKQVRIKHRTKNKKKINACAIKRRAIRRRTDPNFRLRELIRKHIRRAVKGEEKHGSSLELLGCSIEVLKNHLQSKFKEGMTWELLMDGKIHIDHIIPLCAMDLTKEENQRVCFHYSNLRPLWPMENEIKSKRDVQFCKRMKKWRENQNHFNVQRAFSF